MCAASARRSDFNDFDTPAITRCWVAYIGLDPITVDRRHGPVARNYAYALLAEHAARHLDVDGILDLIERAGISRRPMLPHWVALQLDRLLRVDC